MQRFYPIIYIRGFVFWDRELESTTDDPTNGFNIGTTHVRQGFGNDPLRFRFPGPFVRLISDYGYSDVMRGADDSLADIKELRKTIWIHRYYEPYSDTFAEEGLAGRPSIRQAGDELRVLIEHVRETCFSEDESDRRVILIAHSMGGLVCRSAIESFGENASESIEKVVTYGTPHGGVSLSRNWFRYHVANSFTKEVIRDEVFPRGRVHDRDIQTLTSFPPSRFLCVIGTNSADYEVRAARWLTGAGSDGLVKVQHAFVRSAPRVFVHRSHSGRYGLVSSPEAFAAVERFLFGRVRASIRIGEPGDIKRSEMGSNKEQLVGISLVDFECTVGPEGKIVNDRRADHFSALRILHGVWLQEDSSENDLFTFYFLADDTDEGAYLSTISFRIRTEHYDGLRLVDTQVSLRQTLHLRVTVDGDSLSTRYRWLGQEEIVSSSTEFTIDFPSLDLSRSWVAPLRLFVIVENEGEAGAFRETSGGPESGSPSEILAVDKSDEIAKDLSADLVEEEFEEDGRGSSEYMENE